ncbi:MmgE/PrpD family protein [Chelativorans sp. SCAU2101]|uniref:MmgE/PrpD family protein n=1 Tax=Chelativorans petroleitrophicus TaxID=2975484 RepID=A0A9X2X7A7_9HYPH|nr:MmgE/PrpD family protein [Chelativorans petroleitrophicus]
MGSIVPTHAQAIGQVIAGIDLSALGRTPADKGKVCLLDFLSCAFEAIDLEWSRQARAVIGMGGEAHVIGAAKTASAADAAFVNAVAGHGLVREDMHAASISHHGVVVWPTLLALAERQRVTGSRLIEAAIIGYEVGCRIGRALFDAELARLFRPTGLVGPIGAAAGGAYLLALDQRQIASALALAANASGGLNQWPHSGGSDMYFHPGHAARSAVTAVLLAQQGAYGSRDIFEGEAGLFAAFARRPAPGAIALFPDGQADILNVYNKPAPACNFAQTACQAALRLAVDLPEGTMINAVHIRVPRAAAYYPGCDFTGPFERPLQAKMSIQFGVAAVLANRRIAESNYARLDDPEVLRLIEVSRLESSDELSAAFPAAQGAELELELANGRRPRISLADVTPATEAEIRFRFREASGAVLGARRAKVIEDFIDNIEKQPNAGRLAGLCAPTRNSAGPTGLT